MPTPHRRDIAETYRESGFCFPIDVMPEAEALAYRARLEDLERQLSDRKMSPGKALCPHGCAIRWRIDPVRRPVDEWIR